MKKIYEKSELTFALIWIGIYCAVQTLANPLSRMTGVENAAHAVFNALLTVLLFCWIRKNGLMERYGLCRTDVPARKFLWYIPLALLASYNLWRGVAVNMPPLDTLCFVCHMLCVGFVEEVLFRGFLFRAIERDSLKQAVVISSVTFGLGHLLHQVDGSGMGLVDNLCQAFGAVACGFLFVLVFYRGRSLLPCILVHSVNNSLSAFANGAGLTAEKRVAVSAVHAALVVAVTLILARTLPRRPEPEADQLPRGA